MSEPKTAEEWLRKQMAQDVPDFETEKESLDRCVAFIQQIMDLSHNAAIEEAADETGKVSGKRPNETDSGYKQRLVDTILTLKRKTQT